MHAYPFRNMYIATINENRGHEKAKRGIWEGMWPGGKKGLFNYVIVSNNERIILKC